MFASEFKKILKQYPDDAVYVDLFGGSGLLSHIVKHEKPGATVVYNDYDNYRRRLANVSRTNALLADLRKLAGGCARYKLIPKDIREAILERLEQEEATGFVDYITLSSSLLFSMKYCTSLAGLRKESFYNNIKKTDYPPCDDYLQGLEITSCDYRELFGRYKDVPGVVDAYSLGEKEKGVFEVSVESTPDNDIRRDVFALMARKGWPMLALKNTDLTLEDLFLQLTSTDAALLPSQEDEDGGAPQLDPDQDLDLDAGEDGAPETDEDSEKGGEA